MRETCLIFAFILMYISNSFCQNLVPNSSFEELRDLPIKLLPINNFEFERRSGNKAFKRNLNYWFSGNNTTPDLRILSEDYFKNCKSKYGDCDLARTGKNAVGIITYMKNKDTESYREYLEIKLKESLKVGTKTYVELWIKSKKRSLLFSNNIGFYFSQSKVFAPILEPILVTPQVNHKLVIRRINNDWLKIEGDFFPEKPFNFLTIGNFYSNEETSIEENVESKYEVPKAYYIIDDIRVWQEGNELIELIDDKEISDGMKIELKNVEFDANSSTLRLNSYAELEKLVAFMITFEKVKIEIRGHTDNIGSNASNQTLSKERAKVIFDYLISNGTDKERISYKGFGESEPIFSNSTENGRRKNRRVEFVILSIK